MPNGQHLPRSLATPDTGARTGEDGYGACSAACRGGRIAGGGDGRGQGTTAAGQIGAERVAAPGRLLETRTRLAEAIEALMAAFARDSPGHWDSIVLLDSTPVECGRSVETARRSQLADACSHGYSRSHSRWFWGMRL